MDRPLFGFLLPLRSTLLAVIVITMLSPTTTLAQQSYAVVPVNGGDPYSTSGVPAYGGGGFLSGLGGSPILGFPNLNAPVAQDRLWLRGEALYWKGSALETPALVTTSPTGTPRVDAGVLGVPSTTTLFGGDLNDDFTGGYRISGGLFLTPSAAFGIEGEYFTLLEQDDGFAGGTGRTILARPFYDSSRDVDTAQLIDFPSIVDGSLSIVTDTQLQSAMLAGRASLCPVCGGNCIQCQNSDRVDWIVGYRYLSLEDGIGFNETLNSLVPGAEGQIRSSDSFRTANELNALQLGVVYQANLRRVWLESKLRVAIGNNTQNVNINGQSSITELGVTENFSGGLLAQTGNSGSFERERFTMVPEVGLTLGIRVFPWLSATVGYDVLMFPSVVRAGDQIDTDVNSNLLASPVDPLTGTLRPRFEFSESTYYAHGLSVGAQLQF